MLRALFLSLATKWLVPHPNVEDAQLAYTYWQIVGTHNGVIVSKHTLPLLKSTLTSKKARSPTAKLSNSSSLPGSLCFRYFYLHITIPTTDVYGAHRRTCSTDCSARITETEGHVACCSF